MRIINGSIFLTKNEEIDFEENKFNELFGEYSFFFTSKDPLTLSLICM